MNTKKLAILGSIFLLMIIGIFISEKIDNKKGRTTKKDFFPGLRPIDCSKLVIKDKTSSIITLLNEGGTWKVTSGEINNEDTQKSIVEKNEQSPSFSTFKADSAAVVSAIEKLINIKMGDIISNNIDKQSLFEVDSTKGTFVQVFGANNKNLGTIIIGKSGTTWNENYVRMKDSKDVYSVPGTIKYSFHTELKKWRDKTLSKMNPANLKKIAITSKDKGVVTLENVKDTVGNTVWIITGDKPEVADQKTVTDFITSIATLKTYDWASMDTLTNEKTGFDSPDLSITFTEDSGKKSVINFGKKWESGSKRWLNSSDFNNVFVVWQSNFTKSNKGSEDFKKKEKEIKEAITK